jgi:SagB-type dehydrogenase family enzyme
VPDRLTLRPGVSLGHADGELFLLAPPDLEAVGPAEPAVEHLLRQLAAAPASAADLGDHGPILSRLRGRGWLTTTVVNGGGDPVYTVQPHRCPSQPPTPAPPGLVLCPFSVVRRDGEGMLVESPRAWCRIRLHHPGTLALLADLDGPGGDVEAERLRHDLWWAGLALPPDEAAALTLLWSPHELWFHHRSRAGTHLHLEGGFGAAGPASGRTAPPPAVREPFAGPAVDLPVVDLSTVAAGDPPLTAAIERRRSVRSHDDDAPLALAQLGEFLFRCARNRGLVRYADRESAGRPYPSGGAAYELELYPVVRRVDGLAPGLYHYEPQRHRLEQLRGLNPAVDALLTAAATAAAVPSRPQVLLVVTARFGRVMSRYEAMAYALTLKHVGVLYQVMYLVATAMGLAACALGAGSAEQFARVASLDSLAESSVGEFMLGSPGSDGRDREPAT